jgi:hypothetical protein
MLKYVNLFHKLFLLEGVGIIHIMELALNMVLFFLNAEELLF